MPRRCIIPGCIREKNCLVFRVPTNIYRRDEWIKAIHDVYSYLNVSKTFSVCEKHFRKTDFTSNITDKSGKVVQQVEVKRIRLKKNAVPHFDPLTLDAGQDPTKVILTEKYEPRTITSSVSKPHEIIGEGSTISKNFQKNDNSASLGVRNSLQIAPCTSQACTVCSIASDELTLLMNKDIQQKSIKSYQNVHRNCSVYGCISCSQHNNNLKFYRFPRDARCQSWIEACLRPDLQDKSIKQLNRMYVCGLHFEGWMFINKKLNRSAIPILNLPSAPVHASLQLNERPKLGIIVDMQRPQHDNANVGSSRANSSHQPTCTKKWTDFTLMCPKKLKLMERTNCK